jgi:hypothetical protein
MLRSARILATAVVLFASVEALSTVEIVLTNGDRLVGEAVEQKEGLFLLELPAGRTVAVPTELVGSIRFTEEEAEASGGTRPPRIQILLVDGRVLTARAVRRRADLYLVTIGADDTIPLPLDLVERIRFAERDPTPAIEPREPIARDEVEEPEPPEVTPDRKETSEEAGPGDDRNRVDAVAALPPLPPVRSAQLAVLGRQSVFPLPPVEPWRPTDSYGITRDVTDFNPSTWFRIQSEVWRPESSWEAMPALPDIDTGPWYRPANPWRWRPTDGWTPTSQ